MDEEKLNRLVELCESNNKILKKMQRGARIGRIISLVYWLIIIGSAVGAYYYVEPYVNSLMKTYKNVSTGANTVNNLAPAIQSLIGQ